MGEHLVGTVPKLQGPKGTRDFYPQEMRKRRYLEEVWRRVSLRAGFEEVDGPIFEPLELYVQKSGQEIVEQLYTFQDKGGRAVALRPEFTPTLARMVVARQAALARPVKWFNISRVCRYERAQKGRLREFFQWNCDLLGEPGVRADLECLLMAIDALRELGLKPAEVEVRLSSRKLLTGLLMRLGLAEELIPRVYLALDKRGKAPPDVVEAMLKELDVSDAQRKSIDELFSYGALEEIPPAAAGDEAVARPLAELKELCSLLAAAGADEFVRFDISIVRGLAYYTGPVWEVFDKRGQLRSLFGGGRYDGLIALCGGQPMPACGFGAGDVTMSLLLDALERWPQDFGDEEKYYVICAVESTEALERVVKLAGLLRSAGLAAEYSLGQAGLSRQMKSAAAAQARYAVFVGLADCPPGKVRRRDMTSGREDDLTPEELLATAPPAAG
jgi:histidyl-tRNA synthetase